MQIAIPTVIQTQKELYKAQKTFLEVVADTLDTYTNLEQAVGKRLTSFTTNTTPALYSRTGSSSWNNLKYRKNQLNYWLFPSKKGSLN